jgi:chromosome segregation ATPase
MREKQLAHKTEMDASLQDLRSAMDELEEGLAQLKTRAYENVSEKLRIFEGEFFQNLRSRDEAIQEKFSEWQSGVDSSLEELARENEKKRAGLEAHYTESLKNRFAEFQGRMDAQMGNWQEEAGKFQRNLSERMDFSDEALKSFRVGVEAQVKEARQSAGAFVHEEVARQNSLLEVELQKFAKEYENKLKRLTGSLDEKQRDAEALLDSLRSEVTVWQAELVQKIKESGVDVDNRVAALRLEVSDTVSAIQEDLARQRGELRRLENELAALDEDLRRKTEDALSGFESRFAECGERVMRETVEFENSTDEKIRAFRASMQDTRLQFDALHQKLFGSIEDRAKLLSVNLAEIDRRQKNFIEQTKIFERADSLKAALEENLSELKAGITRTDSSRKEIQEHEAQFQRIRKLGEEVSEKLSRFAADKRRIDTLEEDYNRLITMSDTVKQKTQNVAEFDEQLESVQASLRTLAGLQNDVETRFERIEKKSKALDATTEGVERAQAELAELEKKLSQFRQQMDLIPENLDTLIKKVDGVKASGEKIDAALTQLSSIDTLLKDLEKRTEKLQKIREWLARTETRIGELNRDVQDRVKLFGSLLKEETKAASGARKTTKSGAAPLNIRDIVRKLARENWTVEQIASQTKLSRGEVELILELPPK